VTDRPPLRLGLLGAGRMGGHHARVVAQAPRARLEVVVDGDVTAAARLAAREGGAASDDPLAVSSCDAVILATPTETHPEVALALLAAGRPLLIEKPVAANPPDVRSILQASRDQRVPVMCGFVERFNPVITTALSLMDEPPVHILAVRHSPRAPRIETSVVFDLLIHDIDLAFRCTSTPLVRDLHSARLTPPGATVAEVADCTIRFDDGMLATLSSSRLSQRKIRMLHVTTPSVLLELDLLRANISVYRHVHQEQLTEGGTAYRAETIVDIPFVRHAGEPLALQLEHFLDLVEGKADPEDERRSLLPPHDIAAAVEQSMSADEPALRTP
jgi:predicted dehydrogenase